MQLLHWAQNNPSFAFLILLCLVLILKSFVLNALKTHTLAYYSSLFPGVVLHELSHIAGCLITFSKIKNINLFSSKGGHIAYNKSGIPIISDIIISISPLIIGLCAIYFLTSLLIPVKPHEILSTRVAVVDILISYFIASITITMTPSAADVKNAVFGYIGIAVILVFENHNISKLAFCQNVLNIMLFCVGALIVVNLILAIIRR